MEKIKVIYDVMGCDLPHEVVCGLAEAINQIPEVQLIAVGKRQFIEDTLKEASFDRSRLEIIDAEDVITNEDSPVLAIKNKKESSLVVAYRAYKEDEEIKAMVSAGSTGAVLCGAIMLLGKAMGVERPTLAAILPTNKDTFTCLADCGANVDCRPEHLLKFAQLGSQYMRWVFGIEKPRVALLSNGVEDKKGNDLCKNAFALLKGSDLNFVGNMEARTVMSGDYDVVVTDGFGGNILLKAIEGTAKDTSTRLAKLLQKHSTHPDDMLFVKKALKELFQTMDFNSNGGGVLLGINKILVKAHGSANAHTVVSTVRQAIEIYKGKQKSGGI